MPGSKTPAKTRPVAKAASRAMPSTNSQQQINQLQAKVSRLEQELKREKERNKVLRKTHEDRKEAQSEGNERAVRENIIARLLAWINQTNVEVNQHVNRHRCGLEQQEMPEDILQTISETGREFGMFQVRH